MREDQRKRLAEISDRLVEQVIDDADPLNWAGAGQRLNAMDQETRGNAMWCRKVAVQTVALMMKVEQLAADPSGALGKNNPDDEDVERGIARAEKAAAELLDRMQVARAART